MSAQGARPHWPAQSTAHGIAINHGKALLPPQPPSEVVVASGIAHPQIQPSTAGQALAHAPAAESPSSSLASLRISSPTSPALLWSRLATAQGQVAALIEAALAPSSPLSSQLSSEHAETLHYQLQHARAAIDKMRSLGGALVRTVEHAAVPTTVAACVASSVVVGSTATSATSCAACHGSEERPDMRREGQPGLAPVCDASGECALAPPQWGLQAIAQAADCVQEAVAKREPLDGASSMHVEATKPEAQAVTLPSQPAPEAAPQWGLAELSEAAGLMDEAAAAEV